MKCDPRECARAFAKQGLVTLIDGMQVCTFCPRWIVECEASFLLTFPLQARRAMLNERENLRGKDAVEELKKVMQLIHEKRRKAYESDH